MTTRFEQSKERLAAISKGDADIEVWVTPARHEFDHAAPTDLEHALAVVGADIARSKTGKRCAGCGSTRLGQGIHLEGCTLEYWMGEAENER